MKAYRKSSMQHKERPFNVGGDIFTESRPYRYRNRYKGNVKLRRDRINRSYKKGVRQQIKIEIAKELQALNHE